MEQIRVLCGIGLHIVQGELKAQAIHNEGHNSKDEIYNDGAVAYTTLTVYEASLL